MLKWTLFKLSPGSPTCQRWWSSGQRRRGPWCLKRWELQENNKGWLMWRDILQNPGLIDQPLWPQMSRDISSEKQLCLRQGGRATLLGGGLVVCHNQCPSSRRWQPSPLSYSSSSQVQYLYTTLPWQPSPLSSSSTAGILRTEYTHFTTYVCTDTEISFFYFNR